MRLSSGDIERVTVFPSQNTNQRSFNDERQKFLRFRSGKLGMCDIPCPVRDGDVERTSVKDEGLFAFGRRSSSGSDQARKGRLVDA